MLTWNGLYTTNGSQKMQKCSKLVGGSPMSSPTRMINKDVSSCHLDVLEISKVLTKLPKEVPCQ